MSYGLHGETDPGAPSQCSPHCFWQVNIYCLLIAETICDPSLKQHQLREKQTNNPQNALGILLTMHIENLDLLGVFWDCCPEVKAGPICRAGCPSSSGHSTHFGGGTRAPALRSAQERHQSLLLIKLGSLSSADIHLLRWVELGTLFHFLNELKT